ncbi:MAG: Na(+)-translocating NADH-quinone reductase subunit A [Candidatus Symbiothrix sp.]|jgi:Na+-transporting NADH:ubiquinone oxidoreductase subunit A|nr:Na(+)-translocating NADH-quinone reductase subunit A [Candidatus Symbiothrix sp.]
MAKIIKIRQGLNIPLQGSAQRIKRHYDDSEHYTIYPDDYSGLSPKVAVKAGDSVKAGSPVMYDKNYPELKIVSPVSGSVLAVNRGEKRKLMSIEITADTTQQSLNFDLKKAVNLKAVLAESGLLALFKQRPYDRIVNPADTPRDIFVSAFDTAPLAPDLHYIINEDIADFEMGLTILSKLTANKVYVGLSADNQQQYQTPDNVVYYTFKGVHPAGNVGVQINHIQAINKGETVWTVAPQDVLTIGRTYRSGKVDLTRWVALTGSEVKADDLAYYALLPGADLSKLFAKTISNQHETKRYISGNVLTGTQITATGSLHAFDSQITVIPEGSETHELLGWAMPRFGQFSVSRSYPAAWLFNRIKKYSIDARIKGGKRAMIMSNEWDKVFPMDILPEFLIRAILAQDIDKMEELGIYEVAPEDFALCEFVDTSKMELQKIVREGLDMLYKEMN